MNLTDLTSFTSVACDSDLGRLVPLRYNALFDHNLMSLSELFVRVITVFNKASFKPTNIRSFGLDRFAIDINSQYINDLSVVLSAIDTAELENSQTTPAIIKAICMNEKPALRSLTVRGGYFPQVCISLLLEASVISLESLFCRMPVSDDDGTLLTELLSSQTNFKQLVFYDADTEECQLPDGNYCSCDQSMVSCAGNLFVQPDFELFRIHLSMRMSQCAFIVLLNLFLSAPANMKKEVKAYDFEVKICECNVPNEVMPRI